MQETAQYFAERFFDKQDLDFIGLSKFLCLTSNYAKIRIRIHEAITIENNFFTGAWTGPTRDANRACDGQRRDHQWTSPREWACR
jgi:hypothetical protein